MKKKIAKAGKNLKNVIQINESEVKAHLDEMVKESVEKTLNDLLDSEANRLCKAKRYERTSERIGNRAGHYEREFHTKAGMVTLKMPKLKHIQFETEIIERYRRRESSVEEALLEMYFAGVSVRRVEDITEALWGNRVSPSVISDLNQKVAVTIEEWRNKPLESEYRYVWLDGIWLKRSWGGEVKNVSILVAIGVNKEGYRDVLGVAEGVKEDKESWLNFLRHLKKKGLKGTELFISDKCLGVFESLGEIFPEAQWQRCVVHFYRNVFSVTPKHKIREVVAMLKAIHSQEDREAALRKVQEVEQKLIKMKLPEAAKTVREGIKETLAYMYFPREHWIRIRTNNPLERIMREIRRRTRVVGCFPDGKSAMLLVCARLRHITGTKWGTKQYMCVNKKSEFTEEVA